MNTDESASRKLCKSPAFGLGRAVTLGTSPHFMKLGESGRAFGDIFSLRARREFSKAIEYPEFAAKHALIGESERSG